MTDDVTIRFSSEKESDIPRIGHRKRVRVNGRVETLYVRSVKVAARRDFGSRDVVFKGEATLTTRDGMTAWLI